jgi:hypothetical protein
MAVTDGYYTRITLSPKAGAGAESLENLESTIGWIAKISRFVSRAGEIFGASGSFEFTMG